MIPLDKLLNNLEEYAKDPNYKFTRLYRLLYNKEFYYKALAKLYPNKGIGTPGTDGETIDGFCEADIDRIIETLRDQSYQPKPAKRVYIPKKNGKKRPLGLPAFTDKIVQEVIRVILDTIYEPIFSENSHGFREHRSCHTALNSIQKRFTGATWWLEGDIHACFDEINHNKLIEILGKRIDDDRFLNLIRKFLNAGYMEDWEYHTTYSGTPQGGIVSPTLANIYLTELDNFVEKTIAPQFNFGNRKDRKINPEYTRLAHRMQKVKAKAEKAETEEEKAELIKEYNRLKQEKLTVPYHLPNQGEMKRIYYVRYADDWLCSIIGSKQDCENIKEKIGKFLKEELGLELSKEKTLITHADKPAHFLGYDILIRKNNQPRKKRDGILQRTNNNKVVLRIPDGKLKEIVKDKRIVKDISAKQWEPIRRPYLQCLSDLEILMTYNSELRGLYNYYALAENVSSTMGSLHYLMEYSCLKTLAAKHKTSIGKYKKKHMLKGKTWGIKYETKKGIREMTFYNGFKRKKSNVAGNDPEIDNLPNNMVYKNSVTELESRLKAEKCEYCGRENVPLEIHHVNKLKNLKGKSRWEQLMLAKKRKTLCVCHECHVKITNGTL